MGVMESAQDAAQIRCIVGLGNPGSRYAYTWHSIGFHVLDLWLNALGLSWRESADMAWAEASFEGKRYTLIKPLGYMNLSGSTLVPFCRPKGLSAQDFLVLHDDVDLALGDLRLKWAGGAGGHKGLVNLIEHFGASFYRLRLGVGRDPQLTTADYVLKRQPKVDVDALAQVGVEALTTVLKEGPSRAFGLINRRQRSP